MTDKDPKDMTVSEQLRWAANGEPYNGIDENIWTYPTGKIRALAEAVTGEWPSDNEIFSIVADKIDAELAQARELSLRQGAELWAKANGWPDFKEGEDFGAWLDRCAIPRPRFEDGEPVQIGDKAEHPTTGETCTIDCINTFDDSICIGFLGSHPAVDLRDGDRLKRPATEVLGADGLPIKVGETVWGILSATKGIVNSLNDDSTAYVEWDDGRWSPCIDCCNLTHTPPDTQERIDRDARKGYMTYWECVGCSCERCPAMIDGDKPWRWYHADSCEGAMVLDLLRRQRELDKRTGGAE